MEYSVQKISNCKIEFCFDVNKEEWKACVLEAYNKTKGQYQVGGFRKGHVPMQVLVKSYGVEIFYEDAVDIAIQKYWSEAIDKEKDVEIVSNPELDIKEVSEDGLKFVVEITVRPEFTLGKYTGITIDKSEYKVSDKDIDNAIDVEIKKHTRLINVDDRAAALGDTAVIDYSGSVDGKKFDGGTAEKQDLELGSGMFIPGFEEQVVGMSIGEEKDIKVVFPENYGEKSLAAKEAVFAVKLHEIKVKEIPTFDDEFVKDVSDKDTVAEYKAEIKEKLTKNADNRAVNEENGKLVQNIVESTEIEIPDVMVESELDKIIDEQNYRMQQQGVSLDDYLKYIGSTMEAFRAEKKEDATISVKTRLVMEAIIKKEGITATDEETEVKFEEFAKEVGKDVAELKKSIGESAVSYLKNEIINEKLIAFLRANNKFAAKKAKTAEKSAEKAETEKKPAAKKTTAKTAKTTKSEK